MSIVSVPPTKLIVSVPVTEAAGMVSVLLPLESVPPAGAEINASFASVMTRFEPLTLTVRLFALVPSESVIVKSPLTNAEESVGDIPTVRTTSLPLAPPSALPT